MMIKGRQITQLEVIIVLLVFIALAGLATWHFWPKHPIETAAPAIVQSDGSIILQRAPDATAKPQHQIPKGSKVERVMSATIQPRASTIQEAGKPCPPVTVDLTLVRLQDQTRRVVASSKDGDVIAGLDIPVESAIPLPEPKKWAAGFSYNPIQQTPGVWIDRDIWKIRVGIELNAVKDRIGGPASSELRIRAGLTF